MDILQMQVIGPADFGVKTAVNAVPFFFCGKVRMVPPGEAADGIANGEQAVELIGVDCARGQLLRRETKLAGVLYSSLFQYASLFSSIHLSRIG